MWELPGQASGMAKVLPTLLVNTVKCLAMRSSTRTLSNLDLIIIRIHKGRSFVNETPVLPLLSRRR